MSTGIPRPRIGSFSLHISTSTPHGSATPAPPSSTSSASNLGRVPLDARVVLSRRRAGYVRFIGKLASEAGEWYGVALDEAKGDHDGRWQGVSYFECPPSHGVFVRRKEIFYVKEQPTYIKNPPSPVMNDMSDEGDAPTVNGSSDSGASLDLPDPLAGGPPASSGTTPTASLQRSFKSFHQRVLQTPTKLGQSLLSGAATMAMTVSPVKNPSRRTPTRASMIPPPAIATMGKHAVARYASVVVREPTLAAVSPERLSSSSLFDDADEFAAMTTALASHNNVGSSPSPSSPPALSLPPQIDTQPPPAETSRENSPATSPQRRPMAERRHSTFAVGSPLVGSSSPASSSAASATANAVRVLELEKEIVTMRTNHENVVAVLRATNKQHAANVLELRAQVSALADGNSYLQRQLSLKSAQLHELKQVERAGGQDRCELQTQLHESQAKLLRLEQEIAALQQRLVATAGEHESVLVHMQREFQAKQRREREQIKALREDVVALVVARNALRVELADAKETSAFFF